MLHKHEYVQNTVDLKWLFNRMIFLCVWSWREEEEGNKQRCFIEMSYWNERRKRLIEKVKGHPKTVRTNNNKNKPKTYPHRPQSFLQRDRTDLFVSRRASTIWRFVLFYYSFRQSIRDGTLRLITCHRWSPSTNSAAWDLPQADRIQCPGTRPSSGGPRGMRSEPGVPRLVIAWLNHKRARHRHGYRKLRYKYSVPVNGILTHHRRRFQYRCGCWYWRCCSCHHCSRPDIMPVHDCILFLQWKLFDASFLQLPSSFLKNLIFLLASL